MVEDLKQVGTWHEPERGVKHISNFWQYHQCHVCFDEMGYWFILVSVGSIHKTQKQDTKKKNPVWQFVKKAVLPSDGMTTDRDLFFDSNWSTNL